MVYFGNIIVTPVGRDQLVVSFPLSGSSVSRDKVILQKLRWHSRIHRDVKADPVTCFCCSEGRRIAIFFCADLRHMKEDEGMIVHYITCFFDIFLTYFFCWRLLSPTKRKFQSYHQASLRRGFTSCWGRLQLWRSSGRLPTTKIHLGPCRSTLPQREKDHYFIGWELY